MELYVDKTKLEYLLLLAWNKETSAGGVWDEDNRALNQCAVTALVVQDYFGGVLLRCPMTNGDGHYWNRTASGKELDLTEIQFALLVERPIREKVIVRDREYVLSFPDTVLRYRLLKQRIETFEVLYAEMLYSFI